MTKTPAAPAIFLVPFNARFKVETDNFGSRINIGEDCYVRPDAFGRIPTWMVAEGVSPEGFRHDVELLRKVIAMLLQPHERSIFRGAWSERRHKALDEIAGLANELYLGERRGQVVDESKRGKPQRIGEARQ